MEQQVILEIVTRALTAGSDAAAASYQRLAQAQEGLVASARGAGAAEGLAQVAAAAQAIGPALTAGIAAGISALSSFRSAAAEAGAAVAKGFLEGVNPATALIKTIDGITGAIVQTHSPTEGLRSRLGDVQAAAENLFGAIKAASGGGSSITQAIKADEVPGAAEKVATALQGVYSSVADVANGLGKDLPGPLGTAAKGFGTLTDAAADLAGKLATGFGAMATNIQPVISKADELGLAVGRIQERWNELAGTASQTTEQVAGGMVTDASFLATTREGLQIQSDLQKAVQAATSAFREQIDAGRQAGYEMTEPFIQSLAATDAAGKALMTLDQQVEATAAEYARLKEQQAATPSADLAVGVERVGHALENLKAQQGAREFELQAAGSEAALAAYQAYAKAIEDHAPAATLEALRSEYQYLKEEAQGLHDTENAAAAAVDSMRAAWAGVVDATAPAAVQAQAVDAAIQQITADLAAQRDAMATSGIAEAMTTVGTAIQGARADIETFTTQLAQAQAQVANGFGDPARVPELAVALQQAQAYLANLEGKRHALEIDDSQAKAKLYELQNHLTALESLRVQIPVAVTESAGAQSSQGFIARLTENIRSGLSKLMDNVGFDLPKAMRPMLQGMLNVLGGQQGILGSQAGELAVGRIVAGLRTLPQALSGISTGTGLMQGLGNAISGVGNLLGPVGIGMTVLGTAIAYVGAQAVQAAAQFQQYQIQFEVMLGSAERAAAKLTEIENLAGTSPFPVNNLIEANRQLMVFMGTATDTAPTLKAIADVAAFTHSPIDNLARDFGRMFASIKEGTGEMSYILRSLRLMGALPGPAYAELQKIELAVKSGALSMGEAWTKVLRIFDLFGGTAEKMGATFSGVLTRIGSSIELLQVAVGNLLLPIASGIGEVVLAGIQMLTSLATTAGKVLGPVLAAVNGFVGLVTKDLTIVLRTISAVLTEVGRAADVVTRSLQWAANSLTEMVRRIPLVQQLADAFKSLGDSGNVLVAGFELIGAAIGLKLVLGLAGAAVQGSAQVAGKLVGIAWSIGFAAANLSITLLRAITTALAGGAPAALAEGTVAGRLYGAGFAIGSAAGNIGGAIMNGLRALPGLGALTGAALGTALMVGTAVAAVAAVPVVAHNVQEGLDKQVLQIGIDVHANIARPDVTIADLQKQALALQQGIKDANATFGGSAQAIPLLKDLEDTKAAIIALGGTYPILGEASGDAVQKELEAAAQRKKVYETLPKDVDAAWKAAIANQTTWQDKGLVLSQAWSRLTSDEMAKGLADPRSHDAFANLLTDLVTQYNTAAGEIGGIPLLSADKLLNDERGIPQLVHDKGIILGTSAGAGFSAGLAGTANDAAAAMATVMDAVQERARGAASTFDKIWKDFGDPTTTVQSYLEKIALYDKAIAGPNKQAVEIARTARTAALAGIADILSQQSGTLISPENALALVNVFTPDAVTGAKAAAHKAATEEVTAYFDTLAEAGIRGDAAISQVVNRFPDALHADGVTQVKAAAVSQMTEYAATLQASGAGLQSTLSQIAAIFPSTLYASTGVMTDAGYNLIKAFSDGIWNARQGVADAINKVDADVKNLLPRKKELQILAQEMKNTNLTKALLSGDPGAEADAVLAFQKTIDRIKALGKNPETYLTGPALKAYQTYEAWIKTHPLVSPEPPKPVTIPIPTLPAGADKETRDNWKAALTPSAAALAAADAVALATGEKLSASTALGMNDPTSMAALGTASASVVATIATDMTTGSQLTMLTNTGQTVAQIVANGMAVKGVVFGTYGVNSGIYFMNGIASAIWGALSSPSSSFNNALGALAARFETHSPPGPKAALHGIDQWGANTTAAWMSGMGKGVATEMRSLEDALGGVRGRFSRFGVDGAMPIGLTRSASDRSIPHGMSDQSTALLSQIASQLGIQTKLQSRLVAQDPKKTTEMSSRSALANAVALRLGG